MEIRIRGINREKTRYCILSKTVIFFNPFRGKKKDLKLSRIASKHHIIARHFDHNFLSDANVFRLLINSEIKSFSPFR